MKRIILDILCGERPQSRNSNEGLPVNLETAP
jgi:hypothetical protein